MAKERIFVFVWGHFHYHTYHRNGDRLPHYVQGLGASAGKHRTRARQSSYVQWKENHAAECSMNFDGSEPPMDQHGTVITGIQTHLISDGDSKTFSLPSSLQSYGTEHPIEKLDCVGHVQKRLGTVLRNLKVTYRGRKLEDGKTIG